MSFWWKLLFINYNDYLCIVRARAISTDNYHFFDEFDKFSYRHLQKK